MWPSTNASIPAGWTRETALDAFYIKGAAPGADANLVAALGSATHTHTSPAHTPIQNSHTHTDSGGAAIGFGVVGGAGAVSIAMFSHTHASAVSPSATATNNSVAITVDAANNDLSFIDVIYIRSDGSPLGVPNGALGFFLSDTLPASWTRSNGNRYVKGAAAAGNGGATGGSLTHLHTSPAHTHTQNAHSHGSFNSATPSATSTILTGATGVGSPTHTHSLSLDAATAVNQSVTTTIGSTNFEPIFQSVNCVLNGVGAADLPVGIIGIWGGTNAAIPANWSRATILDSNFPKNSNANGESGVLTGGSHTHTHTASDCQPVQNAHTHNTTAGAGATTNATVTGGSNRFTNNNHTHTWTASSDVATNQTTAVTINANTSDSAYPPHKEVIFVQFQGFPIVSTVPQLMTMGFGV